MDGAFDSFPPLIEKTEETHFVDLELESEKAEHKVAEQLCQAAMVKAKTNIPEIKPAAFLKKLETNVSENKAAIVKAKTKSLQELLQPPAFVNQDETNVSIQPNGLFVNFYKPPFSPSKPFRP